MIRTQRLIQYQEDEPESHRTLIHRQGHIPSQDVGNYMQDYWTHVIGCQRMTPRYVVEKDDVRVSVCRFAVEPC